VCIVHLSSSDRYRVAVFVSMSSSRVRASVSLDDGVTWSATEVTGLPNNDAALQAVTLASGRVAIVFNPVRYGEGTLQGRSL
jgi:predicted neuraminidase